MDSGKGRVYGKCFWCGGTLSVHINVAKPLGHHFRTEAEVNEFAETVGKDALTLDHVLRAIKGR